MTSYQLYWRAGSGSMVAEAALRMTGADYALVEVPTTAEQHEAKFRAINPAGKIPVLIMPEGQIVFESMAILMALDERHKNTGLLPAYASPERATTLQWLAFMAASTYPAALRFYYPHRFTSEKTEGAIAAVKAAGATDMDADFVILAAALKTPFLLGDTMTIADVYLAMLADWHEPAMEITEMQRLKAEVLKSPAVKAAWDSHEFTP